MTPFGRFPDLSIKQLTANVLKQTLDDALLPSSAIEAAFFSNVTQSPLEGQYMVPGQVALRASGLQGIPVTNVENACASASTAFHLACNYIRAGAADVVLAIGAEKMYHADKARTFQVFEGAWDVRKGASSLAKLLEETRDIPVPAGSEGGKSVFMDIYAAWAKLHMKTYGTTQRQLAAVAAKNHRHSTLNPLSQYRHDATIDEVLAARVVAWPLTLPMCSPVSDGAAAAILVSERFLRSQSSARAVRVRASVLASGSDRPAADFKHHATRLAAIKAYEQAGVAPAEVSVAEVHDATAFGEIQQVENLGLCREGEGGVVAERGETSLGGRIPVNPSGGLESKGHPIGATGLAQVFELVQQLRHDAGARQVPGARIAVAENGGGFIGNEEAAACITILERGGVQ
jgi:acetyl-CoA acetyltransferase